VSRLQRVNFADKLNWCTVQFSFVKNQMHKS